MSLILCRECGKDVSTTAVTCPHCGAGVKVDSGPGVFGGLMWFFGGLVVVAMLWALLRDDPDREEKSRRRSAIELCWDQQKRKSATAGEARFIASACETMEAEFRGRFGVNP